jgi:predicted regulator of Ras-like GTPase activity (Roadblock/LC7/MglB family)
MKRILQAIHGVDGVQGTLVIDGNGQVLASQAHAIYDDTLIEEFGRAVAGAVDAARLLDEDWDTLSAVFVEGFVILRNLKPGGVAAKRGAILGVIGDSRLSLSFAGVAMRVAALKLKEQLESPAPQVPIPNPIPKESSRPQSVRQTQNSAAIVTHPPKSSSGKSGPGSSSRIAVLGLNLDQLRDQCGLGSSAKVTNNISDTDAETTAFLEATTTALSGIVGATAQQLFDEAVRKVCPDGPLARHQWEALIVELSARIPDRVQASLFQWTMRARL